MVRMRRLHRLPLLLLALACEGEFIEPDLPGTNQPPTTNAELAFRFGGTGSERVTDLVTDPSGDLFVTGSFSGTADFDPGTGITALSSLGETDAFLARYTAAGVLVWVARIGGTGPETATSLARDASGNLYLGGGFSGAVDFDPGSGIQGLNSVAGEDAFIAKYSAAGSLLWVRRFGAGDADEVTDLAVDASGVYAAGFFSGQANFQPDAGPTLQSDGTEADGFIVAFDPAGVTRWALPLGGPLTDLVSSITVSLAGNVVVAGGFSGSADFARNAVPVRLLSLGGTDGFLASYSPGGVLQWARAVGGTGETGIANGALRVDAADGIVLLGGFSGSVDFDPGPGTAARFSVSASDLFVARYDAAGNFGSVLTLGGTGSIQGTRVLVDADASAIVTGAWSGAIDFDPGSGTRTLGSLGQGGATDIFVARYSATGGLLWVSRFGESTALASRVNRGTALALGSAGSLIVGGYFFGTPDFDPGSSALRLTSLGESDVFIVKLTAAGTLATTP